jgi:hypothetical protein
MIYDASHYVNLRVFAFRHFLPHVSVYYPQHLGVEQTVCVVPHLMRNTDFHIRKEEINYGFVCFNRQFSCQKGRQNFLNWRAANFLKFNNNNILLLLFSTRHFPEDGRWMSEHIHDFILLYCILLNRVIVQLLRYRYILQTSDIFFNSFLNVILICYFQFLLNISIIIFALAYAVTMNIHEILNLL